jgi:hypothetical protein
MYINTNSENAYNSNKNILNNTKERRGKLIEPPNINKPLTFSDLNIEYLNDKINP